MMNGKQKKRIKVQLKCPNPLFEAWLEEWLQEARESDSKLQHCYSKALSALKKYPLPLDSGADCQILEGFGKKLCSMLDRKLVLYKQNESDPHKPTPAKLPKIRRSTEYCPVLNSGPYALIVALYNQTINADYKGFLLKQELIKLAQPLSEKSFTKCDPGSYYNAWSSMKTLIEKEFVLKHGNPAKYSLTNEGRHLGNKLCENNLNANSNSEQTVIVGKNDIDCLGKENATENSLNYQKEPIYKKTISPLRNEFDINSVPSCSGFNINMETKKRKQKELLPKTNSMSSTTSTNTILDDFIFAPNTFNIFLLVDTNETNGSANVTSDPLLSDLSSNKVKFEVRNLKVGDFAWIARDESSKELVLPYIIERKRADDLAKSIKDGRFHEQKFRLKQSGIQNLIYLIESHGSNQHTGLPLSTLLQAAVNTLIQDRFQVKYTENLRETVSYLVVMTKIINELYKEKTMVSCLKQDLVHSTPMETLLPLMTFADFNKAAAKNKNLKIKQLFVRQLLQLKGLSLEKALMIVEAYPTPLDLHLAYKTCTAKEGELLLANIRFGTQKKAIGAAISKTIYLFYTLLKYN